MTSLTKNFLLSAAKRSTVPFSRSYIARRTPNYDGRTPNSIEFEDIYSFSKKGDNFIIRQPSTYANQLAGVPSNSLAEPVQYDIAFRKAELTARTEKAKALAHRNAPLPKRPPLMKHHTSMYDGRTPTSVDFEGRWIHSSAYDGRTPNSIEYEDMIFVHKTPPKVTRGLTMETGFILRQPSTYANQLAGIPANSLAEPEPHDLSLRTAEPLKRPKNPKMAPLPNNRVPMKHHKSMYDGRTPTSVEYEDAYNFTSRKFHTS